MQTVRCEELWATIAIGPYDSRCPHAHQKHAHQQAMSHAPERCASTAIALKYNGQPDLFPAIPANKEIQ